MSKKLTAAVMALCVLLGAAFSSKPPHEIHQEIVRHEPVADGSEVSITGSMFAGPGAIPNNFSAWNSDSDLPPFFDIED
jgi:hypothetical protein